MLQSSFVLLVTVQLFMTEGRKNWFNEGGVEPAKVDGGEFG